MEGAWENCDPNEEQWELLEELDALLSSSSKPSSSSSSSSSSTSSTAAASHSSSSVVFFSEDKYTSTHNSLQELKLSCDDFIGKLDSVLSSLEAIEKNHSDVTGRTNVLMVNCETLLEQQSTLQEVVHKLKEIITPFDDVEKVAGQLGIPVDAIGRPHAKHMTRIHSGYNLDPRSAEFRDALSRISIALKFLADYPAIRDYEQYLSWLKQLQRRANSLIAKAMLGLLDNANKICTSDGARNEHKQSSSPRSPMSSGSDREINHNDTATPALESMLVYTKFRGLGFRMRELGYMLKCSELMDEQQQSSQLASVLDPSKPSYSSEDFANHFNRSSGSEAATSTHSASGEVRSTYKQMRCELLEPIVSNTTLKSRIDQILEVQASQEKGAREPVASHTLSAIVRSAFATMLHIAQLEQQLYISLFHSIGASGSRSLSGSSGKSFSADRDESEEKAIREAEENDGFVEVTEIIDTIAGEVNGHLRALIIKGAVNVHGLCRVIHTITEDVQSQLDGTRLHPAVYDCLSKSLQRTTCDARERLIYCAEAELRRKVQLFDPLPSQLAFPDLLSSRKTTSAEKSEVNTAAARLLSKSGQVVSQDSRESSDGDEEDISATWYPPLKHTLSLLSLLYGVVDSGVFEDLARRAVAACIDALVKGAAGVRRWKNQLHGDFFLTRHLLILREQLIPFDMNLKSIEKHLDFVPTRTALSSFLANSRSLLRMDQSNSLLHLALEGLPAMSETQVDVRKNMDEHLKSACQSLKYSALHFLLGPVESFLAKVSAFIGSEIPLYRYETSEYEKDLEQEKEPSVLLPAEARESLKNQSFVKPDRIKHMLNTVLESLSESYSTFSAAGRLYIDNPTTRDIILKPIHQEISFSVRRMRTIVASCVNPGQERKDIETLLSSVRVAIKAEMK